MPFTNGVAQQETLQTEFPGVLCPGLTEAQGGPLLLVQAPANSGVFEPTSHQRDVAGGQTEPGLHRRHFQQSAQAGLREAFCTGAQQPFHGHQQGRAATVAEVRHAVGNTTRVVGALVLPEHRTYGRLERGYVRHHHHHIAWGKLRALQPFGKQAQQLVVKDLHFALRVVGDVKHDGAVCGCQWRWRTFPDWHQIADACLHLGQQRCLGLEACFVEEIDAAIVEARTTLYGAVVFVEQADEVPRLPPPARQQRVAMRSQLRQRSPRFRHARAHCVPPGWRLQHFPVREEICPVVAARVRDGHDNLAELSEFRHGFQRLARYVGGAEQDQPARQPVRAGRPRIRLLQLLQESRMHGWP